MPRVNYEEIMGYIREYNAHFGFTPSLKELQRRFSMNHMQSSRVITTLAERGEIERTYRVGVYVIKEKTLP